jgi:hypothetical protein
MTVKPGGSAMVVSLKRIIEVTDDATFQDVGMRLRNALQGFHVMASKSSHAPSAG